MARIRTIKPELWTDESLTECCLAARLLFIGMLNFSDDNGNQPYSAKRLKMQIFPADPIDTAPLLKELIARGMLLAYSVDGKNYLHIKGFTKHQVINKPSITATPKPPIQELSGSTPVVVPEESGTEGKGMEGKGKDIAPVKPASKSKSANKTTLPNDFAVSGRVAVWAGQKGYGQLSAHLENFISAARRKGYTYADWDEALMEAIRKNWAGLSTSSASGVDSRFVGAK